MNKLKSKVFFVVLIILSAFLISILAIFNYQIYKNEEKNITNNLMRINGIKEGIKVQEFKQDKFTDVINEPKIFMDYTVYTVILNNKKEILDVVNNTTNNLDDESIEEIAQSIIDKGITENIKVGNLYFEKYSYYIRNDNIMTIIDNSDATKRLALMFNTSIIIFVLLEIVIFVIDIKLTDWIIKPVFETFEKQKQFIADASHELKTPLAVIMANEEALENDITERKWLNNIKSETERMSNLVTNLLDMASLESGVKQQYQTENLSKLVEISILPFESIMYENNIKLDYVIDENITLNCNASQIKQLISILIDNAIKHSENKSGEIKITLKKEKNSILLNVVNKGKAIPKEEEEKIFERFYRLDESRNREDSRYGLGLAIAKSIVENHNGKIFANSSNGYTTFTVQIKEK